MTTEYAEAVTRAKRMISASQKEKFADYASGKAALATAGSKMLKTAPLDLIAQAEADAMSFDALRLGIAQTLKLGEKIPPEAFDWLLKYMCDDVQRPKAKSGAKSEVWLHGIIWVSVRSLISPNMTATRNDESPPFSACDAVAEAMAELGLKPATFFGVKRVWLDCERHGSAVFRTK